MIAFLMRILFEKYSLYFPPPPRIYFLLSPFPFFPSSELHVFLVTSRGDIPWLARCLVLPVAVASWQVAGPSVEPGGQHGGGGRGPAEEVSRGRRTSNLHRLDLVHLCPHHLDTVQDFFLVASQGDPNPENVLHHHL